jgi:nucleotide-binding universal stress UspA family protein
MARGLRHASQGEKAMGPFKHILVPTDFGEPAERALELAMTVAEKFDAKVTILHAAWIPPIAYGGYGQGLAWPIDDITSAAKEQVEALVAKAKKRLPSTDGVVTFSEPAQTILDVAKERGADLIVMGTNGRRGLSRVLLGSVTEKTVRRSPVPVLTVSGKTEDEAKPKGV